MTAEESLPDNWPSFEGPRPEYKKPPVIEVALSVQFEPLNRLIAPHMGKIWGVLPDEFCDADEHPPLARMIEGFEATLHQPPEIKIEMGPAPMRCWFKNTDGSQLIQIQRDRFVFNWRRFNWQERYPRYEYVRDQFIKHFQQFSKFVEENSLGPITPDQCEVTYVNHVFVGEGISSTGALQEILSPWGKKYSDSFLGPTEEIRIQTRHRILDTEGQPLGRLYVNVEPRRRASDQSELVQINVMARGAPADSSLNGVLAFFNLGREYIVRGFTSITSAKMHKFWERTDV